MHSKKVRLFIVEGGTDKTALGLLLQRLFTSNDIDCDVFGSDIFGHARLGAGEDPVMRESNILKRVNRVVSDHVRDADYEWRDLEDVVILTDTDGCFVPGALVIERPSLEHKTYSDGFIEVPNAEVTRRNNAVRSQNIIRTVGRARIKKGSKEVPLTVYYLSRNLEHALHGEGGHLSKNRKIWMARQFAARYKSCPNDFVKFLNEELACPDSYQESWRYIQEGTHSLERGSNLSLLFSEMIDLV